VLIDIKFECDYTPLSVLSLLDFLDGDLPWLLSLVATNLDFLNLDPDSYLFAETLFLSLELGLRFNPEL